MKDIRVIDEILKEKANEISGNGLDNLDEEFSVIAKNKRYGFDTTSDENKPDPLR